MATTIKTSDGDVLDRLCHQHYGHLMGTVEAVLEANPDWLRALSPSSPASSSICRIWPLRVPT